MVEPASVVATNSSELEFNLERILNDSDVHISFLVTANETARLSSDVIQRLKIIRF